MADFAEQLQQDATEEKAQISQEIADAQATRTQRRAEMEKELADKKAEYQQLKANAPQPTEPPKLAPPTQAPNTQEMLKPTSLQKQFGLASIFALLSVGLAKGSAIYGLKALGGFMEGAHASNVEQAKAALDDFNSNMKVVHDANENALHEYNAIWQDKKQSWDSKLQLFREKALQFEDKLAIEKLDQGDVNGIHQLNKDRANVQKSMATELLRNEQIKNQMAHYDQMAKLADAKARGVTGGIDIQNMALGPIDPNTGKREEFLAQFPEADQELIKAMANGQMAASGFGNIDQKRRTLLIQGAQLYDPNFNARKFQIGSFTAKEFSPVGAAGKNILAINTMIEHIDQFASNFDKLNNSQVQRWNTAKNKLATEFGDPALLTVQQSALRVAGEYAKIIKGGAAAPTDQEMQHWESVFTTNMSKAQMNAVVWDALDGAGGRLDALQQARDINLPGEKTPIIYPRSRQLILKHKPKSEPEPEWLGGGDKVGHIAEKDMDKEQERQSREFQKLGIPIARNPKTGARMMFKDGQWQPLQ
jgi:hypothetical protein